MFSSKSTLAGALVSAVRWCGFLLWLAVAGCYQSHAASPDSGRSDARVDTSPRDASPGDITLTPPACEDFQATVSAVPSGVDPDDVSFEIYELVGNQGFVIVSGTQGERPRLSQRLIAVDYNGRTVHDEVLPDALSSRVLQPRSRVVYLVGVTRDLLTLHRVPFGSPLGRPREFAIPGISHLMGVRETEFGCFEVAFTDDESVGLALIRDAGEFGFLLEEIVMLRTQNDTWDGRYQGWTDAAILSAGVWAIDGPGRSFWLGRDGDSGPCCVEGNPYRPILVPGGQAGFALQRFADQIEIRFLEEGNVEFAGSVDAMGIDPAWIGHDGSAYLVTEDQVHSPWRPRPEELTFGRPFPAPSSPLHAAVYSEQLAGVVSARLQGNLLELRCAPFDGIASD